MRGGSASDPLSREEATMRLKQTVTSELRNEHSRLRDQGWRRSRADVAGGQAPICVVDGEQGVAMAGESSV
jgi:hypothetical protein